MSDSEKGNMTPEQFHFEDDEVFKAIVGTDYLKEKVLRFLHHLTSGEKWSLYRAVVKLARENMPEQLRAGETPIPDDLKAKYEAAKLTHNINEGQFIERIGKAEAEIRELREMKHILTQTGSLASISITLGAAVAMARMKQRAEAAEAESRANLAEWNKAEAFIADLRAKLTTARDALAAELIAHFDNMATQTVEIFDVISDIRRIAATEKGEL